MFGHSNPCIPELVSWAAESALLRPSCQDPSCMIMVLIITLIFYSKRKEVPNIDLTAELVNGGGCFFSELRPISRLRPKRSAREKTADTLLS